MTTGTFRTVPLDSIIIDRAARQRRVLTGVDDLAASIERNGLINPPLIRKDGSLVAGETRVEACRKLGWTSIPVQFAEDLDPAALMLIELEENIRRIDLPWQDQCLAVEQYHKLRLNKDSKWNNVLTAGSLGMTEAEVRQRRDVAREILGGNQMVLKAERYSIARGITERKKARQKTEALNVIIGEPDQADQGQDEGRRTVPILNTDFIAWAESYSGPKFNFIHCDFPYGVSVGGHGQAADKAFGNYDDSPDTFWLLTRTLLGNLDRIAEPSAHLMFWFSMKFYERTRVALMEGGWQVGIHPLVWLKSDGTGILPDSNMGPRQIYETAFHCIRGKRPIVRAVSNAVAAPTTKTVHMSEKPVQVLEHFFRMYVDENTRMLDPTCGSANALKAALRHGASGVLGIERDPEFYEAATTAWEG